MGVLDPAEIDKFGKIIGLLGSDHDGERAVAARKATEFLSARQLAWADVTDMLKRPPVVMQPKPYQPEPGFPSKSHQMDARRCLNCGIYWKAHERQFLEQMIAQRRAPTEKQEAWLDGLCDRMNRYKRENPDADF